MLRALHQFFANRNGARYIQNVSLMLRGPSLPHL